MKNPLFLVLLALVLACGKTPDAPQPVPVGPVAPVVPPVVPVDPEATVHATGFKKSSSGHGFTGAPFHNPTMFKDELPVKFDWRNLGFTVPVRDQASCGSCWAFSTIASLDSAMMIFQWHTDLASEQEIVDCAPFYGCQGGDWAGKYLMDSGVAADASYPYVARDQNCQAKSKPRLIKPIGSFSIGASNRPPTIEELKAGIMQYGYLSVSVYAHSNWDGYKGGVMTGCKKAQANHMVNLVGWDEQKKVWIMRNEWGEDWGDKGYALMPYGCDSIADDAAYVTLAP